MDKTKSIMDQIPTEMELRVRQGELARELRTIKQLLRVMKTRKDTEAVVDAIRKSQQ